MRRPRLRRSPALLLAAATLAATGHTAATAERATPAATRVRGSEAFAPCLAPALEDFTRESGVATELEVGDPDPPGDADVVVGDDSELTRLLESGRAPLESRRDLGYLPWVYVVPAGSPAKIDSALSAAESVAVLGGPVGREARASLRGLGAFRLDASRDSGRLRRAAFALVPRSLAGPGELRPAGIRRLVVNAALVASSTRSPAARQLLAFLASTRGRAALATCSLQPGAPEEVGEAAAEQGEGSYAAAVVDWWLPACTLQHNAYNDPQQVLGPPDAVFLGTKDHYQGFMSLGQGGYVTVDMGSDAVDGPGPDVRVYQTVSGEPVTLYASDRPDGPFVLVGLREYCGIRTPGVFSNHCDFDLQGTGLSAARYFKVEDGEIYPCLSGGTVTEGADIDAVEILNPRRP